VLVRMVRKGQRNEVTPVLDAAQRARAQALLKDSERPS
jgi:hypothetical protein